MRSLLAGRSRSEVLFGVVMLALAGVVVASLTYALTRPHPIVICTISGQIGPDAPPRPSPGTVFHGESGDCVVR